MADYPMIFSAPMIRDLLAGRKSQTRRLLRPPYQGATLQCTPNGTWVWWLSGSDQPHRPLVNRFAPYDRLWVREAHALVPASAYRQSDGVDQSVNPGLDWQAAIYRAGWCRSTGGLRWRPSIHMPRWASRLTLTVTEARVQRLHAITEADALAEGVLYVPGHGEITLSDLRCDPGYANFLNCRMGYEVLWNSLHGAGAWDANPWIVAISFGVRQGNIDV